MRSENGLEVDLAALDEVLARADVLTVGFTLFPERLLIDVRTKGEEGPLVAIVGPVQTVQERYLWLGQHRGNFGAPEAFSFFVWPKMVRTLVEEGRLGRMSERLGEVSPRGPQVLDRVLQKLVVRESEAMASAVRGDEPWRSVWHAAVT
ncbi:MAG: hypothetical protein ACR2HN_11995 [Tepidiformaceae bacterium]